MIFESGVEGEEFDAFVPSAASAAAAESLEATAFWAPAVSWAATGLKLGADDYVTKPFEAAELMARIQVILRRTPVRTGNGMHQFGSIVADMARGKVMRDGKPVRFSASEFQLLRYLIERSGTPVSQEELLTEVLRPNEMRRAVRSHLASLRNKIEVNPKSSELILTVAGFGYKFAGSRTW